MANVLRCTQTCVDCRTQAAQEDVEVIVDRDSEQEDEGGPVTVTEKSAYITDTPFLLKE